MARTASTPSSSPVPPETDELAAQVLRQFRQIFNAVKTHFRQIERQAGIGGAQLWALGIVKQSPGLGVTELARRMDVHASTASNLVRGLVDKGLLETLRDEIDRRAVRLRLTPLGNRTLRAGPGPFEGVLPDALRDLDPAALRRLQGDLDALLERLDADDEAARIPLAEL